MPPFDTQLGGFLLDFYRTPSWMTTLPDHPALVDLPTDLEEVRRTVQGLLLHPDWAHL